MKLAQYLDVWKHEMYMSLVVTFMRCIYFCKSRLFSGRRLSFYSARSYSFAEYWKHFMAHLNGIHTFDYNSARNEPIGWNLGQSEYIVRRWPCQILGAIRAEARARERADFLFFCRVSNVRFHRLSVDQISRKLHTRRKSVSWWTLSEQNFDNFRIRGRFFKKANFSTKSPTTSDFRRL